MREILFRGKRVDNDEWVYGSFVPDLREVYFGDEIDGFIKPFGKTKEERLMVEVDRESVGQYTGLTDKNGKRVFEADILSIKCADEKSRPYPVYFGTYNVDGFDNDFHIGFYTKHFGEDISLGFLADSNGPADFEVIGNIFDNPELLEGDKRKGYWFDVGSLSCRCSECGCKNNKESNYCPECGAYMKGESDDKATNN